MPRKKGRLSLDQRAALPLADDNPEIEYLRLNRQQICLTEINAAVRLFFLDDDPISAHLLASAATEIMVALSNQKPGVGLNDMRNFIKTADVSPEMSDELFQGLLHPYNFPKHGSSDFTAENDFSVEYIIMTIYTAIHSYREIFEVLSTEMTVFYNIVQAWRIHWWEGTPNFQERLRIASQIPLIGVSREEMRDFGRRMLCHARRGGPTVSPSGA